MALLIDPRGVKLAVCACGVTDYAVEGKSSHCGFKLILTRQVNCADIDHNEPGGCGNPKCWKHRRSDE